MLQRQIHTVQPTERHTHTIIFLHGRDSNAEEFASDIFESQGSDKKTLPEALPNYRWVFPTAEICTASCFDTEMSQWFDIWSLDDPGDRNQTQQAGLKRSTAMILALIELEAKLIPYNHIFLVGISQGCATAIYTLLKLHQPLGGFIGLNSWLPYERRVRDISKAFTDANDRLKHIQAIISDENSTKTSANCLGTPGFLAPCEDDEVILQAYGKALRDALLELRLLVEWHDYKTGGHWLNEPQGVDELVGFIRKQDR